jgi:hypothetical protein
MIPAELQGSDDIDGGVERKLAGEDALESVHHARNGPPVGQGGAAITSAHMFEALGKGQLLLPREQGDGAHLAEVKTEGVVRGVGIFGFRRLLRASGGDFGLFAVFIGGRCDHIDPGGFFPSNHGGQAVFAVLTATALGERSGIACLSTDIRSGHFHIPFHWMPILSLAGPGLSVDGLKSKTIAAGPEQEPDGTGGKPPLSFRARTAGIGRWF